VNKENVSFDDERRIIRTREPLGDPVLAAGGAGKVRPERQVIQHNVRPAPAYFRGRRLS